jgi:hypothetical protein
MSHPRSASNYDVPDGAHVPLAGAGQIVYRRLAGASPGPQDFRSDRDRGRPHPDDEPWIEHAGPSVFDSARFAVDLVVRFPVFVAEFAVPPGSQCSIAKTGPRGHYTVWGDPDVPADAVTRIFRQNHASGTLEEHT